jgi:hypothetical protein
MRCHEGVVPLSAVEYGAGEEEAAIAVGQCTALFEAQTLLLA